MLFEEIDITDISDKDLLGVIETNARKAAATRGQIERLKEQAKQSRFFEEESLSTCDEEYIVDEIVDEDDSFEDEVAFYLNLMLDLGEDFTEEELLEILPPKNNYNYENIIKRLIVEALKEIKEYTELSLTDETLEEDDLIECKRLIQVARKKISNLEKILNTKEEIVEEVHRNKIVLVPTSYGNIRITNELEHIPQEYYPGFLELINSIIDGSFKNVKPLTRDGFNGIYEVKDFKIRVLFARLTHDTYALISAFVKKFDTDKFYSESLDNKYAEYKKMKSKLLKNLNNPDFITQNEENVIELFRVLGVTEDKAKKFIKGGKND
ncbi:MAG: hypothetical protein IJI22_01590 [Bacilli bacterium]|nr:hypothetical protein [Bacilli bacterium]